MPVIASEAESDSKNCAAALVMAEALERLIAVVDRELNTDASEGVAHSDPAWADAIAVVVDAAQSSAAVLDLPDVHAVLARASRSTLH